MTTNRASKNATASPVRLELDGKRCGCTFTYRDGFVYKCAFHKARREAIAERRREASKVIYVLRPEPKPTKKGKKFQPDSPEQVKAIRADIRKRTVILRKERAKIDRPTKKLTKAQLAHLHTFAFSSEQVRKEILAAS